MKADVAAPNATRALRRAAWLCAALMAVVVVASAFLRHLGASAALQAAWAGEFALARQVHRVAATLVLIGAVVLVVLARRARSPRVGLAWTLLGVGLLLSVVGVVAGASRAAPVVLVNLLGGVAMLGLSVGLAAGASHGHSGTGRAARWLLAFMALQVAGGAIASAQALPQCALFTDCSLVAVLHRASGVLLAPALLVWGARTAWCDPRWDAAALVLTALLLLMVGALSAGIGSLALPVLVVAHNALGTTAVALLVWQLGDSNVREC
jgi:hypothetical protein